MSTPAFEPAASGASKLRLVLDYVPCEVCLAQPNADQEILCSICARVHREVGVRVARRTSVIVERPDAPAPAEPVVIPPAPAAPMEAEPEPQPELEPQPEPAPEAAPKRAVEVVLAGGPPREGAALEIVVEPYEEPAPAPVPVALPEPVAAPQAAEPATEPLVSAPEPAPAPEPQPEPEPSAAEAPWEAGDEVFARPPEETPAEAEPAAPAPEEDAWEVEAETFAPPAEPEPAAAEEAVEEDEEWDDEVASFTGDDFGFTPTDAPPPPPREAPREERRPERHEPPAEDLPQDDFVFRPPTRAEPEPASASSSTDAIEEDDLAWAPTEEVPVETEEGPSPWAPPGETDFLNDEMPPPPPPVAEPEPEEEILDTEIVETEIVETTLVEPEEEIIETEIVEMEIVEDEPAEPEPLAAPAPEPEPTPEPQPDSDLFRLRGFDASHFEALAAQGITSLSHLSGHDPNELAERAGLSGDALLPWVQAANLVHEVGVPIDAAVAMVAAGVAGPQGLAEMEADDIVDRVHAFGNASISARDVKRWKRRV